MKDMGMEELMSILNGIKNISITKEEKEDLFTKNIKQFVKTLSKIAKEVQEAGFSQDFAEALVLQIVSITMENNID